MGHEYMDHEPYTDLFLPRTTSEGLQVTSGSLRSRDHGPQTMTGSRSLNHGHESSSSTDYHRLQSSCITDLIYSLFTGHVVTWILYSYCHDLAAQLAAGVCPPLSGTPVRRSCSAGLQTLTARAPKQVRALTGVIEAKTGEANTIEKSRQVVWKGWKELLSHFTTHTTISKKIHF